MKRIQNVLKLLLLSTPLLAHSGEEQSIDLGASSLRVREALHKRTLSGEVHQGLLQERLNSFDKFSDYVVSKYRGWRTDVLGVPLFSSSKGNFKERIPLSYKDECRAERRIWNANAEARSDLESKRTILESTANPFDLGSSLSYLGHLRPFSDKKDPRCADSKRKSAMIVSARQNIVSLNAYFRKEEIDFSKYIYVANVSHRDATGEDLFVARIARNSVRHILVHQVNFATGLKKLEEMDLLGAAHFQMRFQFAQDVLLREQRINPRSSQVRTLSVRDLVFSVEANGEPGFSYALLGGAAGILSEEVFGKFMNTFRLKTLDTTIYDSVLSRKGEDRKNYPTLQFPLALSENASEDLKRKNQVLLNALESADAFGEHTSYNTLERSCSVWGFETLDRPNVMNHKHLGSINEHLPHRTERALKERGLLQTPPDSKISGRFGNATRDYYNLHFEICQTQADRFEGLECEALK